MTTLFIRQNSVLGSCDRFLEEIDNDPEFERENELVDSSGEPGSASNDSRYIVNDHSSNDNDYLLRSKLEILLYFSL